MAEKIKNIPSPDILMNSLRSIGYSFKTALADIIDNSISVDAKNIWIDFPSYNSDNLYITILDDAVGMPTRNMTLPPSWNSIITRLPSKATVVINYLR